MRILVFALFILGMGLFGCSKKAVITPTNGISGQWKWENSGSGPTAIQSSSVSAVIVQFNPDNTYKIFLNGSIFSTGTYQINLTGNQGSIKFNNITQSPGNNSIYNYIIVGQLTLFENEEVNFSSNTLQLTQFPISPEDYISNFSR